MSKPVDNKKDFLLLLLFSPGDNEAFNEPVVGRTRIVKMLFLFYKECLPIFKKGTSINEDNFYQFFPWNFGPFSKQVYDDIIFFILRGYIEANATESELLPEAAAEWEEWMSMSSPETDDEGISEYDEQSFRLSDKGIVFAKELYESLSVQQKTTLKTFKTKMNRAPLKAILKYVYQTYPEFTTRSQIREQVIGRP